jgi:hypothetical protein
MPIVLPLEPAIRGRGCRLRLVPRSTRILVGAGVVLGVVALIGGLAGVLHHLGWTRPMHYDTPYVIVCHFGDSTGSMHGRPEPADRLQGCERFTGPLRGECLAALAAALSSAGKIRPTPAGDPRPDLGSPITDEEIAARIAGGALRDF